jgi:hypothetical protein
MATPENGIKTRLTREELYALVWSQPMLKVAAKYGVSSSYMARVCTLLNVPRPQRGYWAKLAFGKVPRVAALPDARPGDGLAWSRGKGHPSVARPLPRPPETAPQKMRKLLGRREGGHPLLNGAKTLFESSRLSYEGWYLKPTKKLLVDLVVTKTGLDKALSFANQLFLTLEANSYRVMIAPHDERFHRAAVDEHEAPRRNPGYNNLWSPGRCTIVYIGTVAVGLTIIEMSQEAEARYVNGEYVRETDYVPPKRGRYAADHTWTTKKDFPTGRLCLQAYSPYPRAAWVKQWRETKDRTLQSGISAIVRELESAVVELAGLIAEGERQAQLEHQRWTAQQRQWRLEEAQRKAAEAQKASKEALLRIVHAWAESRSLEQFFKDVERQAADCCDEERLRLSKRLKLARQLIGGDNALERFIDWKSPDEPFSGG